MQKTLIQPYLFFGGRCEEALRFYEGAVGARVEMMMRYKDSPEPLPPGMVPAGSEDKVMHCSFHVGDSLVMAADNCTGAPTSFNGFSLSLVLPTVEEVDRAFAKLSDGGSVTMPLQQTFWSKRFGMLTDRFGMGWMLSVWEEMPKG